MKNYIAIYLLAMLALVFCTGEGALDENHFFVSNKGASMPVYVRGNAASNEIILFLHGGPGGNASQATFIPSFQELEKSFSMVYWDQRGSGLSQGNPDESTFTVEQFVEDTYFVIQALKQRYPGKKIYLFGHSWGGALGAAYLSTANYQDEIAGFVCMNSGHNLKKGLPLSVDWVENYAREQIELNSEPDYWTEVRDWCQLDPDMTYPPNYFRYAEYLRETDAYRHDKQSVEIDPVALSDILNSRLSLASLVGGQYLSQNFNILELDLSRDMGKITIPALILWGRHDGVNVLAMGEEAYLYIGTDSSQKEFIILENSAHEGYLEEPDLFRDHVTDFVERYR